MMNKDYDLTDLYRDILTGISLSELMNTMSTLIERSLVLSDLSFRVLAYSTNFPVTDPIWINNISRGFCTYEFISEIQKLVPDLLQKNTTETFLVDCDVSEEHKLVCPIIQNNQLIAYLLLLDNGKGIPDNAGLFMQHFSTMTTFVLKQLPNFHRLFGDMVENILDELLETGNTSIAKERLKSAGVTIPSPLCCLSCIMSDTSPFAAKYVRRTLRHLFPLCILSVQDNCVLCYTSVSSFQSVQPDHYDSLKKAVRCIGVSPHLSDISEFLRGYKLALHTCNIHDMLQQTNNPRYSSTKFVRKYEDYRFYNLLLSCSDHRILKDNIHSALNTLQEYDAKNNSVLLETLRCFLEHDRNITDTAKSMFIHRNTISYRLSRIVELTGLNLDNYQTRVQLDCSFFIFDLMNIAVLKK